MADTVQAQHKINYQLPTKQITSMEILNKFLESAPFNRYLAFLEELNNSVKGKDNDAPVVVSSFVLSVCAIISRLSTYIDEIKPKPQSGRFANPAYRDWFAKMEDSTYSLLQEILPPAHHDAVIELSVYFKASCGDKTRMDYGTGHEMNFTVFLYCLYRIGVITPEDFPAVVIKIFLQYIEMTRKLQLTYWLEPAGSKGVHALDDFQFLPFYFGSAQILGHPIFKPKIIRETEILEAYHKKYMFLGCIKYINQVKKGPFFEHSPTLDGIASVLTWEKVNQGMMKMYKGEVICKLPVMQHFFTGGILPLN